MSAKVLLDHGVDPNQTGGKDNQGVVNNDTMLCVALAQGAAKVARELILHGANVNVVAFGKQTPLSLAKQHQNKELIALLKARGAKELPKQTEQTAQTYQKEPKEIEK